MNIVVFIPILVHAVAVVAVAFGGCWLLVVAAVGVDGVCCGFG